MEVVGSLICMAKWAAPLFKKNSSVQNKYHSLDDDVGLQSGIVLGPRITKMFIWMTGPQTPPSFSSPPGFYL